MTNAASTWRVSEIGRRVDPYTRDLGRFAAQQRYIEHVAEAMRLGRAPFERVITVATRAMLGPWDQVLTDVAVANGAAK